MDLKGDEAFAVLVVHDIGHQHPVQEGTDATADALDAARVPVSVQERRPGFLMESKGIQPAAAGFIVDSGTPGACGRIELVLIAIYYSLV